ncbi:MAG: RNA-binding protein [Bdellovibrionales bacterium]|nr:RNA-binding protein [Bdellovibrionales bacterium]
MLKKIFVGNCDYNVNEESLKSFIEAQGIQVANVKIIYDQYSGKSRGFAFVELAGSEDLVNAIENLNGKELEGRAITVNEARAQTPRFAGGGGGNKDFGGRSKGGQGRSRGHGGNDKGGRKSRW